MIRKNKGFTLVELIAVIAILGFIAIIAIPEVMKAIEKSRKESLIVSAKGITRAAQITRHEHMLKNNIEELKVYFNDGNEITNISNLKLDYSGKQPKNGALFINSDGKI